MEDTSQRSIDSDNHHKNYKYTFFSLSVQELFISCMQPIKSNTPTVARLCSRNILVDQPKFYTWLIYITSAFISLGNNTTLILSDQEDIMWPMTTQKYA